VRSPPVQLVRVPVRRTTALAVAGRAPPPCLAGRRRPSSSPPVRAASGFTRTRSSLRCNSRASWGTPAPDSPRAAARRRAPPRLACRRPLRAAAPLAQHQDRRILIQRPPLAPRRRSNRRRTGQPCPRARLIPSRRIAIPRPDPSPPVKPHLTVAFLFKKP
jgi:hypothetical protein